MTHVLNFRQAVGDLALGVRRVCWASRQAIDAHNVYYVKCYVPANNITVDPDVIAFRGC